MKCPVYLLPLATILFIVGVATLSRFASGVRPVEAVGLSGGGFAIGVGFGMLVLVLTGTIGSRSGRERSDPESERRP
jgi:hypothetical protein